MYRRTRLSQPPYLAHDYNTLKTVRPDFCLIFLKYFFLPGPLRFESPHFKAFFKKIILFDIRLCQRNFR